MFDKDTYIVISEFSRNDFQPVNKSGEVNGRRVEYVSLESSGYADFFDEQFNHLGRVMVVNHLIEKTDYLGERINTYIHEDENFFHDKFREKYGDLETMPEEKVIQYITNYPITITTFSICDGILHTSFDYHISMQPVPLTRYVEHFVSHLSTCFIMDVMCLENNSRDEQVRSDALYYGRMNDSVVLQLYRENVMLKWESYKNRI